MLWLKIKMARSIYVRQDCNVAVSLANCGKFNLSNTLLG